MWSVGQVSLICQQAVWYAFCAEPVDMAAMWLKHGGWIEKKQIETI